MATVPRLRRNYRGATTSCSACPSAYWFASRLRRCLRIRVRHCAPAALQAQRRAGIYIVHAGHPPSSDLAHGQEQDLPGFLAPHPVTLRRSTTPDDPSRLAAHGASGAAPRLTTLKALSLQLSRLTATLRHPLSTLHDGRCRTPCKTRFRLAGCTFAGRESNPLDRYERFQIMSSSSPGLTLAQYSFVQRVMALSKPPSPAVLGRAEPGIAADPVVASSDGRTNAGVFGPKSPNGAEGTQELS